MKGEVFVLLRWSYLWYQQPNCKPGMTCYFKRSSSTVMKNNSHKRAQRPIRHPRSFIIATTGVAGGSGTCTHTHPSAACDNGPSDYETMCGDGGQPGRKMILLSVWQGATRKATDTFRERHVLCPWGMIQIISIFLEINSQHIWPELCQRWGCISIMRKIEEIDTSQLCSI